MSIPHDSVIQSQLLKLLSKSEDGTMKTSSVYDELAELFPELSDKEVNNKFQNSVSQFANRVQFVRLHCVERGLIYSLDNPESFGYGYWTITQKGREYIQKYLTKTKEEKLKDIIQNDIESFKEEEFEEGGKKEKYINYYERNPELREKAISIHGTTCKVCGFNFLTFYGNRGKNFIEVHHLKPVSTIQDPHFVNPKTEMTVVCSNCHRMIHRFRNKILTVEELKLIVNKKQ